MCVPGEVCVQRRSDELSVGSGGDVPASRGICAAGTDTGQRKGEARQRGLGGETVSAD